MIRQINLLIIGNGFDLCHGYKTSYDDFRNYLIKTHYESCYYPLLEIFDNGGIDWSDFEENLSEVTLESTYKSIIPKFDNNDNDKEDEREWRIYEDNVENLVECANELPLDLTDAMNDWILYATKNSKIRKIKVLSDLISRSDLFVNFNFSASLEDLYKIPSEKILFIHGKAKERRLNLDHHDPECGNREHNTDIVIGHSKTNLPDKMSLEHKYEEMDEVGIFPSELCRRFIKPLNLDGLSDFLRNTNIYELHIFGHSLGVVDLEYFKLLSGLISSVGKVNYYLNPEISFEIQKEKYKKILNCIFADKSCYLIEYDNNGILRNYKI